MNIQGLQKLTLLDYPGKVACTIFTGGCNFRCPFCHNSDLVVGDLTDSALTNEQIMAFLHKRRGLLDGVCISGGEPLLQADIAQLLSDIRSLGYQIKLDTNGSQPAMLKALAAEGLVDYVAMDIKNAPSKYAMTIGINDYDLSPIKESVAFLLEGTVQYEFRTTVVQELHEAEDFVQIGQWINGAQKYFLQGFEASERVLVSGLHSATAAEMQSYQALLRSSVPQTEIRGVDDI